MDWVGNEDKSSKHQVSCRDNSWGEEDRASLTSLAFVNIWGRSLGSRPDHHPDEPGDRRQCPCGTHIVVNYIVHCKKCISLVFHLCQEGIWKHHLLHVLQPLKFVHEDLDEESCAFVNSVLEWNNEQQTRPSCPTVYIGLCKIPREKRPTFGTKKVRYWWMYSTGKLNILKINKLRPQNVHSDMGTGQIVILLQY